jgi:hypothetical protein
MHSIESNFPQEEKKMKKSIMGLSLVAAIATFGSELPIQNGTSDDNIQLVIAVDNSGLNSNRCSSLFKSNMDEINHILHRKSIKTMKLNHLSVYVFNENIKHIGTVQEKKRGSFRRKSKEVLNDLKNELRVDTTKKSKDVWGVVKYLNILATNVNHKVVAVIFSNLRHSTSSKASMKSMKKIKLAPNLTIKTYSKSGLECLKGGGATITQIINSQNSYKAYFMSKIDGKFTVETIY